MKIQALLEEAVLVRQVQGGPPSPYLLIIAMPSFGEYIAAMLAGSASSVRPLDFPLTLFTTPMIPSPYNVSQSERYALLSVQ